MRHPKKKKNPKTPTRQHFGAIYTMQEKGLEPS